MPSLEFLRVLHLHRRGAGISRRPARRIDVGIRVAVHADDQRHHDRRLRSPGASPGACPRSGTIRTGLRVARGRRRSSTSLICAFAPPFVAWNVLPIMIYTVGSSLIMPSVTLLLLDLFPTMRGMTSSLQGFVQFALGGVVAGTIAPLLARSLTGAGLGHGRLHGRELRPVAHVSAPRAFDIEGMVTMSRNSLRVLAVAGFSLPPPWLRQPNCRRRSSPSAQHKVTAEVAVTPEQRAVGLMNRFSLKPDHGMLFVFERSEPLGVLDEEHVHPAVDRVHRRRRPHRQHRGHATANRGHALVEGPGALCARNAQGLVRREGDRAGGGGEGIPAPKR